MCPASRLLESTLGAMPSVAMLDEFEDAWADWGIEIEDIRAAEDRVVARIRYRGVGKQSGAPITGGVKNPATGAVFDLRAGRILRVLQFVTHTEALEAVGLSE